MNQKLLFVLTIIIVTFGYVTYQSLMLDKKFSSFSTFKTNTIIKSLPKVILKDFGTGKGVDLNKLAASGNNLVVHFWATWCAPCEKEFPDLLELTELLESKKDVKFLFIAVNDSDKKIKKFLARFKKYDNFLVLIDNENVHQKSFGTFRLPETYLFGKDSKAIRKFIGRQEWNQKHFVDLLEEL
jgi:cytochrome c biogenesis protein CcmG/thiol:disulfide interchange protein DsbE